MVQRIRENSLEQSVGHANSSLKTKLMIGITAVAIGGAGYGIKCWQVENGYLSKDTMLKVTTYAVQKGYQEPIWKIIPDTDRHKLMKQELRSLPLEKSWEIVKPTLDSKAEREYTPAAKDARFIYKALKDAFGGD